MEEDIFVQLSPERAKHQTNLLQAFLINLADQSAEWASAEASIKIYDKTIPLLAFWLDKLMQREGERERENISARNKSIELCNERSDRQGWKLLAFHRSVSLRPLLVAPGALGQGHDVLLRCAVWMAQFSLRIIKSWNPADWQWNF